MTTFYAHSGENNDKSDWQPLYDHLMKVAQKVEEFINKAGVKKLGFTAGLLHDIGKYSIEFQKRLEGNKTRVDHSTAGAIAAEKLYKMPWGRILAYIAAGHHAGLPDGGSKADTVSLTSRLEKDDLPDYSAYNREIVLPSLDGMESILHRFRHDPAFSISFFIRMLFSCLVDADYLDTEEAIDAKRHMSRLVQKPSLPELLKRLDAFLKDKAEKSPDTPINRERNKILEICREKAHNPRGLFSLTVPTGGGKTLSSLEFALRHAVYNGMDRVIYVIPFTSIIEQNAQVFRDALGDDAVLEHHSNYSYPDESFEEWSEDAKRHRLASENWDMPVIATTAVQFFESLFANRSSPCRKLHNIINSVIILDEAQMLPTDYLKPCLAALAELVKNYNTTVVFCTATQPAVSGLIPNNMTFTEIIPEPERLYEKFKRVKVQNAGEQTDDVLAQKLRLLHQVLCIVNTRRHAQLLYQHLAGEKGVYHLSARMCPAHRTAKLSEIRKALRENKPCRVISTQLIEAGVDVDFPTVYRSSAGIDSIVQAAGRCNREGKIKEGKVWVFQPEKHGLPSGWFSRVASLANMTLRHFPESPISLEAVESYFSNLYSIEGERLDSKAILAGLKEGLRELWFPFEEIASKFKLIEQEMQPVIIPFDQHAEDLMRRAENSKYPGSFARALQAYTVQIYPFELAALSKSRIIRRVADIYWFLEDSNYYDETLGLLDSREVVEPKEVLIY